VKLVPGGTVQGGRDTSRLAPVSFNSTYRL